MVNAVQIDYTFTARDSRQPTVTIQRAAMADWPGRRVTSGELRKCYGGHLGLWRGDYLVVLESRFVEYSGHILGTSQRVTNYRMAGHKTHDCFLLAQ